MNPLYYPLRSNIVFKLTLDHQLRITHTQYEHKETRERKIKYKMKKRQQILALKL